MLGDRRAPFDGADASPVTAPGARDVPPPLIEPVSTPLVKYFCRNGYTHRIGTVARTITAFWTLTAGGGGMSGFVTLAMSEFCTTNWLSTTWIGHLSVSLM